MTINCHGRCKHPFSATACLVFQRCLWVPRLLPLVVLLLLAFSCLRCPLLGPEGLCSNLARSPLGLHLRLLPLVPLPALRLLLPLLLRLLLPPPLCKHSQSPPPSLTPSVRQCS